MKTVKIVILVLALVFVFAVVGLIVIIKTLDLNRFKAQIQEEISKSIDRDVSIRNLSFNFSLNRGIILDISGLAVKDHPEFSSENMLYIDTAHFDMDVLPFISDRHISIRKVELHSPKVSLIRNSNGEFNFQQLDKKKDSPAIKVDIVSSSAPEAVSQPSQPTKENRISFGELLIRTIRIADGTVIFTDRSVTPEVSIPVAQLEVQISNLSFNDAFPIQVVASL